MLANGLSNYYDYNINKPLFDYINNNNDKELLNFHYRGFRLIEEIITYQPDIITLQEIDQIEFFNYYL